MFELDLRSRQPVYEQLVDKVVELIVNRVLKPDEQLPSVRALSAELTINPNTIQKAYRELEYRDYIYSLPGKGSFVKPRTGGDNSVRLDGLKAQLAKILSEMLYLGMSPEQVASTIESLLSAIGGGNRND